MKGLLLRQTRCLADPLYRIALYSRAYSNVPTINAIRSIKAVLENYQHRRDQQNQVVRICGYAKSIRSHRKVTFVDLTDGSLPGDTVLQVVLRNAPLDQLSIGASLEVIGQLQESRGAEQPLEFTAKEFTITGTCNASVYPLATPATHTTPSLLRKYAHLRSRNARHASVLRCRNIIERAISDYFWETKFVRVVAPIITLSDCEGGGEVFTVDASVSPGEVGSKMDQMDAEMTQEPSLSGSSRDIVDQDEKIIESSGISQEPSLAGSSGDDPTSVKLGGSFWADSRAYLTVSSQLHLEAMTYGLGRVYTIGPSFRAESSATNRHLAEFWMCEAEIMTNQDVIVGLDSVISIVEALVKSIILAIVKSEEVNFLWQEDLQGLQEFQAFTKESWPRMTYSEATELLQSQKEIFTSLPYWGESLTSEHERWLARNGPIFITDYPSSIKPFYMRANEGNSSERETVACFDLLVPRIGELVGGSLREERKDALKSRFKEDLNHLQWYTDDLRKFGPSPHGGFGLGMERLLSWLTKTENLRDCLTFPRVKGPLRY